jgi:hypothetical protein
LILFTLVLLCNCDSNQVRTSTANVFDFGAKGDGKTDDTLAFQKALNSFNGLGGIVWVPSGTFYFTGSLTVPKGVTFSGTYKDVPSHGRAFNPDDLPNFGTVLLPTGGRNNANGTPFITLSEDSAIDGVTIYYPNQGPTGVPVAYPWTIDMTGNNPAVTDIECLNCFNFIRAVNSARHYIARVQGQPINTGIYVDQTYDIGRIENVHWNPWYSQDKTYFGWQLINGRAFVIARSDWEYVFNTFAFGYAIGYHFIQSSEGACNGNFLGIGADMAANASVLVEAADPWGILITNGEFTAFVDPNFGPEYTSPAQIVVASSNTGAVHFSNTAFWGPSDNIARIAGGSVSFTNCIFSTWDGHNKGDYAIVATAGDLQISTCDFQKDGNQIELGTAVKRATIVGNLFAGTARIQNHSPNAQIGLNAASA